MMHANTQSVDRKGTFSLAAAGAAFAIVIAMAAPLHVAATAQQPAAGQTPTVDIRLTSKPSPPKTGDNTFEVICFEGELLTRGTT